VLRDGAEWDPAALEAHCRGALAGWQVPRRWVRAGALPRSASGKVPRRAVRDMLQG
jgi:fatty-acyl-CoA synthase